jgi:hypothetical protein
VVLIHTLSLSSLATLFSQVSTLPYVLGFLAVYQDSPRLLQLYAYLDTVCIAARAVLGALVGTMLVRFGGGGGWVWWWIVVGLGIACDVIMWRWLGYYRELMSKEAKVTFTV